MRSLRGAFFCVLLAGAAGCIGAVNPIIPDGLAVFEPQLLGTWSDSASRERAVITQTGPDRYGIQYTDEQGQTVSLVGRLGRSGEHLILDLQPAAAALGPYKDLVVPLHIPLFLDSIGPRIHAAILEPDSLDQYLKAHPRAVAHGRTRDGLALTADSPDLWQFLLTYPQRPGVLSAPTTWLRRTP